MKLKFQQNENEIERGPVSQNFSRSVAHSSLFLSSEWNHRLL